MKGTIFFAALFLSIISQSDYVHGRGTRVTIRYGTALKPAQKKRFNRKLTRSCKRFMPRVLRKTMKVLMKLGLNDRNKCTSKYERYRLFKKLQSNCENIMCNSRSIRRCLRFLAKAQKKFIKSFCLLPTGVKKTDVAPTPSSSTTPTTFTSPSPSPSTSTPKKQYLYTSKGLSAYGYPPPCSSKSGQTCSAYCPTGAAELQSTAFSCPAGHKCCAAAACPETCDKTCGAGATELKDYYCPSAQKCCRPPTCGSVERQRCFASACPIGAEEEMGYKCSTSNTNKCCKLQKCEEIAGQSCSTAACPYDVAPLPNFFCNDNAKCCPSPSASPTSSVSPSPSSSASVTATASSSITPTATVSASISVSPSTTAAAACGTVDGQKCYKSYCPKAAKLLPARSYTCAANGGGVCCQLAECTTVEGQTCENSSCPYSVAALGDFNCEGSQVCCPKPSARPTPTSSASPSVTPSAASSVTPSVTSATTPSPSSSAAAACGSVDGQTCYASCPPLATKLPESVFTCATGVCCQLKSCESVNGQLCAPSSCPYGVSPLANFNCPGSEVCCPSPAASMSPSITPSSTASVTASVTSSVTPSSTVSSTPMLIVSPSTTAAAACASAVGQKCYKSKYCPTDASLVPASDFTCAAENGDICCKLQSCTSVSGQSCVAGPCSYGAKPLTNFYCSGTQNCCPAPSARATTSSSVTTTPSASPTATSSVSPAPSSSPSASAAAKPQPCPTDGSHECKIACFHGYVDAKQYTCSYGSCCAKLTGYVEALSDKNSSTPYATAKSAPATMPESTPEVMPEASPESEESTPEATTAGEDGFSALEEAGGDGCEDYGGKCEAACGADSEEDPSVECNDKKKCCFPIESQKCEGDLLKCTTESQKCSGTFVDDLEGCASGQKCCESEPCVVDYSGSCKESCGSGEEEDGSCAIMNGKCCIPQ